MQRFKMSRGFTETWRPWSMILKKLKAFSVRAPQRDLASLN
ncbi:hypothetical protein SM11_chr0066 [Sinorhizobium meliloti SM11]|uniref:Uncharacterized protein n=1 Tax=Sinorhizobium meliloti (strain SM11) TaxID=707241 RepID=F7X6E8_SINMM|nr:hypothetical protein SM11_chr0066 [Sinorhizobium meliloti SM11]PII39726.1 hypothetical protein T190_01300 [Sinorhizobium meliloti CCBAU 01290]